MLALGAWEQFFEDMNLAQTLSNTTWVGWLMLMVGLVIGIAGGKAAQSLLHRGGQRLSQRQWLMRGAVFTDLGTPVRLFILTIGLHFGFTHLAMSEPLRDFSHKLIKLLYVLVLAWFSYNLVDLLELALRRLSQRSDSRLDAMVLPLIRKTCRVFIVIVFALFTAGNIFNADISAWLAGLGIAGLAVSLAAQESLKNIFGSITIFLDRPFAVGDAITFNGFEGNVEEIGLRSTRLRTADGQLITIPNSKFVDGAVQNNTRRPNLRRVLVLTIPRSTAPGKIDQVIPCLQQIFSEPQIAMALDLPANPPRIYFDEITPDGLNIRIFYWLSPRDFWSYLDLSQRINLRILQVLQGAEIELASPTRTIQWPSDSKMVQIQSSQG